MAHEVLSEDRRRLLEKWSKRYFKTIDWIEGSLSGGVDPPRILLDTIVQDSGKVLMRWNLPQHAGVGMSDSPYHVKDHARIRTDEIVFLPDGTVLENGRNRLKDYEDDPWYDLVKDEITDLKRGMPLHQLSEAAK